MSIASNMKDGEAYEEGAEVGNEPDLALEETQKQEWPEVEG